MQIFSDTYTKWTRIFFAVMTVFAVVFANERFQADGAHYLLHVVQSENFRIEHQRFILAFSQILPWIGVKLGLPLSSVIVLNSINPVVWWLALFLYATYFLRDRKAGIGIILTMVFGVLHIQFIPMYEIWYGVPLLILLYSHLNNDRTSGPLDLLVFFGILITALFAHPLLPIQIAFLFLYHIAERKKVNWKLLIPVAAVTIGWYITKKLLLTDYESGKMSLLTADWNHSPEHLLSPGYHWGLLCFFFKWYTIPMLLFVWTALFFLVRRMKWHLLLLLLFFCGHVLLINFTHTNDPLLSPYFERMYLPLIPIVLIPFLFTVCRELEIRPKFALMGLFLLIGWRIARFTDTGLDYKQQTATTMHLISVAQNQPRSKFIIDIDDQRSCYNHADWSYPMEILIRSSAMENGRSLSIVQDEDLLENNNAEKLKQDEFLFRRWDIMKDDELNQRYFHLEHGTYRRLPCTCNRHMQE